MHTNPNAKRILCYWDSNTRWRIPWSMWMSRYHLDKRRPWILQNFLGENFEIIEEWLWWRTTMFDDSRPEFPLRNWLQTLPIILESHLSLDLVILMLGTTDTKEMMNLSSEQITQWMEKLIHTIKNYKVLDWSKSPQILIVVPPIVNEAWNIASTLFKWSSQKWNELIQSYKKLAEDENVLYIDPTSEIKVDEKEGIHIDSDNHQKLAKLVFEIISET